MPFHHTHVEIPRLARRCVRACLLAMCAMAAFGAQAHVTPSHPDHTAQPEPAASPLAIKVYDDRETVDMAGASQIYLYGVIDADAPARVAALIRSSKIPHGSDVYLNASGDDIDAGMALGRMLRAASISTHLGRPTRGARAKRGDKSSICTGACVFAYLGGVYRWAPTGQDRFGIASRQAGSPEGRATTPPAPPVAAYLAAMGIPPEAIAAIQAGSHNAIVWLTAEQMILGRLANNGRQPLIASYRIDARVPRLELDQILRRGEQRLTLQCKPGSVLLAAYSKTDADHARHVVRYATRSYLDIDGIESLSQPLGGASVDHDAVTIHRALPPDQLGKLLAARSIGAWINQPNGRLRYGFAFSMQGIGNVVKAFYDGCWKYAPWPVKSSPRSKTRGSGSS